MRRECPDYCVRDHMIVSKVLFIMFICAQIPTTPHDTNEPIWSFSFQQRIEYVTLWAVENFAKHLSNKNFWSIKNYRLQNTESRISDQISTDRPF